MSRPLFNRSTLSQSGSLFQWVTLHFWKSRFWTCTSHQIRNLVWQEIKFCGTFSTPYRSKLCKPHWQKCLCLLPVKELLIWPHWSSGELFHHWCFLASIEEKFQKSLWWHTDLEILSHVYTSQSSSEKGIHIEYTHFRELAAVLNAHPISWTIQFQIRAQPWSFRGNFRPVTILQPCLS